MDSHINEIERKTEAAYQTILYIAEDEHFRGIQVEAMWKMLETCLIPIITHGSETWDINKTQIKRLNRILYNIIKRLLRLSQTTPRECL